VLKKAPIANPIETSKIERGEKGRGVWLLFMVELGRKSVQKGKFYV